MTKKQTSKKPSMTEEGFALDLPRAVEEVHDLADLLSSIIAKSETETGAMITGLNVIRGEGGHGDCVVMVNFIAVGEEDVVCGTAMPPAKSAEMLSSKFGGLQ